jgi:hypothetical protein
MARTVGGWGAYLFKDKDPEIDVLRTLLRDELGGLTRKHLAIVEANGGPIVQTLDNWLNGDTMQPKNPSMEAAGRAVGFYRKWTKMGREDFGKVLIKAHRVVKTRKELAAKRAEKARKKNGKK